MEKEKIEKRKLPLCVRCQEKPRGFGALICKRCSRKYRRDFHGVEKELERLEDIFDSESKLYVKLFHAWVFAYWKSITEKEWEARRKAEKAKKKSKKKKVKK